MNRISLISALLLSSAVAAPAFAQDKVDFKTKIAPIFKARCYECHGADKQEADLRFDQKKFVFTGKKVDWVIQPGDADGSYLVERITLPADDDDVMPAKGKLLTKTQIKLIKDWIDQGAEWPESADEPEVKPLVEPGFDLAKLSDADRERQEAALAALRNRGAVAHRIAVNTHAIEVNLSLRGSKVGDAELELLGDLAKSLVWLNLSRTSVTDSGLSSLVGLGELRRLHLAQTEVGDDGLASVGALGKLEYLNLFGSKVTDAGLEHLAGLKRLRRLYLWQTETTKDARDALARAIPGLKIIAGEGVAAMQKHIAALAAAAPVNAKCPLLNKPVNRSFVVDYKGTKIGFCCGKCKANFLKNPKKFAKKIAPLLNQARVKQATGKKQRKNKQRRKGKQAVKSAAPLNKVCPVSNKPVNPRFTSTYEGRTIAFCCGKCKKAFDANPAKFAKRIGQ